MSKGEGQVAGGGREGRSEDREGEDGGGEREEEGGKLRERERERERELTEVDSPCQWMGGAALTCVNELLHDWSQIGHSICPLLVMLVSVVPVLYIVSEYI